MKKTERSAGLMSLPEAAEWLGMSEFSLRGWVARRWVPATITPTRRIFLKATDLVAFRKKMEENVFSKKTESEAP